MQLGLMHSALRAVALVAAILGATATDGTKAPTPIKAVKTKAPSAHTLDKGARTKKVRLCVSDFDFVSRPVDVVNDEPGVVEAQENLYAYDSFTKDSGPYIRKLGAVSFTCSWGNADTTTLVPCAAVVTVGSAAKIANKTPYSTFVATGWKTVENLSGDLFTSDIVAPLVLRSSGSWPKPDSFKDFAWEFKDGKLAIDITYKTKGWNPVYTK